MANYQYKILEIKCIAPSSAWDVTGRAMATTLATLVVFFKGLHPDYRNQILQNRNPNDIIAIAGLLSISDATVNFVSDLLPATSDELDVEIVSTHKTERIKFGKISGRETLACGDSQYYTHRQGTDYRRTANYDQFLVISDQPVNFSLIEVDRFTSDDLLLNFSLNGDEQSFGDKKVLIKTLSSGDVAPDVSHPNGLYVITFEITVL